MTQRIDFEKINRTALSCLPSILARWLPDGKTQGAEYVAKNPLRNDRHSGSFKVNLYSGKWGDFATGDSGGDIVSLGAFLTGISQKESALALAEMLGVDAYE
ncbi:hypothetical protein [Terasakiella sp. SH-1]|uniref:hypothetical protein n=1 Tax=Terasakiella sp. SH-1 TaxID=2560057 RepID=UPI0010734CD7|nr:hypothetical protein [Terasakiella sp. SH-1]